MLIVGIATVDWIGKLIDDCYVWLMIGYVVLFVYCMVYFDYLCLEFVTWCVFLCILVWLERVCFGWLTWLLWWVLLACCLFVFLVLCCLCFDLLMCFVLLISDVNSVDVFYSLDLAWICLVCLIDLFVLCGLLCCCDLWFVVAWFA